ncbi:hypothetical protein BB560_004294, partial [Smittium megazygosporum]
MYTEPFTSSFNSLNIQSQIDHVPLYEILDSEVYVDINSLKSHCRNGIPHKLRP